MRTERLVVAALGALAACSPSPSACPGPGSAPAVGVTADVAAERYVYGDFRWGANNDCPAAGTSVISVTISGVQKTPAASGFGIGLCLPRPDLVDDQPIPLGDTTRVKLVSLGAQSADGMCTTRLAAGVAPTGTLTFAGFCTQDGNAYAMTFAGQVGGTTTCVHDAGAPTSQPVTIALGGTVAVTPR